jgi:lipopolysaccharide/colanic/teichoic acid biosynthesis glycosyltransferase/glycosyltransferase involved in cell wall biosynthesis
MKILYVHQYFATPSGSAGTRSYELGRALVRAGHQVHIVCASGERADTGLSGPHVNGRRDGVVDGLQVTEFALGYSNADSIATRARKFVVYALRAIGVALTERYDLIFATSTPLTAALPGIAAKVFRRKPFVFEVRDLWPELPRAMGMKNPWALGAMSVLERSAYAAADRVVALAPGIAEGVARTGYPLGRIETVPNACDLPLFDGAEPVPPSQVWPDRIGAGDFVAVFAGAHGRANGLDAVVAAARELEARGRTDIKLLLIGTGSEKPRLEVEAAGVSTLVFADPINKTKLASVLRGADLGLQILADVRAFYRGTSPNKFFDYLAAGRPVLINYPGWLAEYVQGEQCGWVVPPGRADLFADALIEAADHRDEAQARGRRARALAERDFDRERLAGRFVALLQSEIAWRSARARLKTPWKRCFDIVASAAALVLLSPVLAITALAVRLQMGAPVLFRQTRPGLAGRPFEILKFRTMRDATDASGRPLDDGERLTGLGRFLRATSLDELPEFWNVLRGDMSLVGPRPLLMQYLPLYSAEQARRHDVRPGLTGLAQVNGRNALSWDEKFGLDIRYVDGRSFWGDLKILFSTVFKVLRRDGISAASHATMPAFEGSRKEDVTA